MDNPEVRSIKHMAFAVRSAQAALDTYAQFLGVDGATVQDYPGSRNRVALFVLGGVEFQLCESMDPGGRFDAWIQARGHEGLHHICYEVGDLDHALAHAQAGGAALRMCQACGVTGKHPHPEGFIAFLDNDAAGVEIEFMQVYTPAELQEYARIKGI